jgi:hypothetical protein
MKVRRSMQKPEGTVYCIIAIYFPYLALLIDIKLYKELPPVNLTRRQFKIYF